MFLVLIVAIQYNGGRSDANPSEAKSHGALGQGFFIPKLNLLTDELHAVGAKIFESVLPECTVTNDVGRTLKDDTFYSNTESLYKSVSTNSKIGASLKGPYTLGASLAAVTNNIVSGNTEISGISLDLKAYSKDHSLKKDCINRQPLDKELLEDFEGLEKEIKRPWLSRSWRRYKVFLQKHGSHVVNKVFSGSSLNQYAFAKSSQKYSQRDFTVKACVSLGGLTNAGKLGVSACSGVTKEEARNASSTSMVEKLVVRGGTPKTRAQLTNERNKDIISMFLQEGTSDPTPIEYTFVPMWNILKTR